MDWERRSPPTNPDRQGRNPVYILPSLSETLPPSTLGRIRNALRERISRNTDGLTAEHENGSGRAMFLREGALASIVFWLRGDRLRRRRLQVRPRDELDAYQPVLRRWYLPVVGLLT